MALGGWGYPLRYTWSYRRADALSRYARRRNWAAPKRRPVDGRTDGRPGTLPMGLATSERDFIPLAHA